MNTVYSISFYDISEKIGLSEFINCILVDGGVRNAMLIQSADYKERDHSDPITKSKLEAIYEHFPNLIQSNLEYDTLISKKKYTKNSVNTDEKVGEILGYPCSKDFQYTLHHRNDEITYTMEIVVRFTNESKLIDTPVITNVCKDTSMYPAMEQLAKDAERVLKNNKIIGSTIESVDVEIYSNIPPTYIIDKILKNVPLNEEEIDSLRGFIYNIGFPGIELQSYNYEYNNPIHQGVLITLLSYYKNDPIEPFFPLQNYPEQYKKINVHMENWQNDIIRILEASRGKTKVKGGGKRCTKKRI